MNYHRLEKLFSPASIAVIGASDNIKSVGAKVLQNLCQGKFNGEIYLVNPKHERVQGRICFGSVKNIKHSIDLAIISAPAKTVPMIIAECGQKNIQTAIVLSSGFSEAGETGEALEKDMLAAANEYQIHIIGPNCLGVMRPYHHLNATFANDFALPGSVAVVSQSGALCASILDWSISKKIGFSTIVSLGNSANLDFTDMLDYLAIDPQTKSILLYIEGIKNPRHFMSALRSAARLKPVVVIKSGKNLAGSQAALSHTGALIGKDDVFDVALKRAGAVRVSTMEDLFYVAEILSINKKLKGNRLVIITNGGGAGVMAADRAADLDIELTSLTDDIIFELNNVLPSQWSHQNPIDIIGDATPNRYRAVLEVCQKSENIDGILIILVPIFMSNPVKVAKEVIKYSIGDKVVLACWLGEKQVKTSWSLFAKYNIPYFNIPEKAVEAFSCLAKYYQNQKFLTQISSTSRQNFQSDIPKAKIMIEKILTKGHTILTSYESKEILKIFGIPVSETFEVNTVENAIKIAEKIGMPVVMKINSSDISHKSKVDGVILNLRTVNDISIAFEDMMRKIKINCPNAKISGVTIEPQYPNQFNREIMIGMARDIIFGPVISFGAGGTLVEVIQDRALALPPLTHFIAKNLIQKTHILKFNNKLDWLSKTQFNHIVDILLRVSEMVCELPYIQEMDINPFILHENGMLAVDARIVVAKDDCAIPYHHLVIHPYPNHLISNHTLLDNSIITIRPICPEDAQLEQYFIRSLSAKSRYSRFMGNFRELSSQMLIRFTQIDYDREMALVAVDEKSIQPNIIGLSQYAVNLNSEDAEFALVIADEWHGRGIGTLLMNKLIEIAKCKNIKKLIGMVFAENDEMLSLVKNLGFEIAHGEDQNILMVTKKL